MMFITTIPPTTSEMSVIGVTTIAIARGELVDLLLTLLTFTRPKSSSSPPLSLWWTRSRRALVDRLGEEVARGAEPVDLDALVAANSRPYVVIGT